MATKNQTEATKDQARTYWRAGRSQRWIAGKMGFSPAAINSWVKGVAQDLNTLVNDKTIVLQRESELSVQERSAVQEVVYERTKHLEFFNKAGLILARAAVKRVQADPDMLMQDMRHASEVVSRQRDGVLGKAPDVAVQVNNTVAPAPMTRAEVEAELTRRGLPTSVLRE